jgi:5-methylcytosine-specific restriction endonuclease McrA
MSRRYQYSNDRLNSIFDRTDGKCHLCHRKLSFSSYGVRGAFGAWQVDHSVPLAHGGSENLNNLFAACTACNLLKGTRCTATVRRWLGTQRAPLSLRRKKVEDRANMLMITIVGASVGASMLGRRGVLVGALAGAFAAASLID